MVMLGLPDVAGNNIFPPHVRSPEQRDDSDASNHRQHDVVRANNNQPDDHSGEKPGNASWATAGATSATSVTPGSWLRTRSSAGDAGILPTSM